MLLLLALPNVVGSKTLIKIRDLQDAVSKYNSDKDSALAMYGQISDWEISKITDMSVRRRPL